MEFFGINIHVKWRDPFLKMLIRFLNKKRAVSPVIAVILLIGLAVAAVAAIFLVVLPLLEPSSKLEMTDAYIIYDDDYTQVLDDGEGYGKGIVTLSNAGTGEIEINSIEIYYAIAYSGPWIKINDSVSIQEISPDNPYILDPQAFNDELTVRFPIPEENDDATIYYKMIVETGDGTKLDTTKESIVSETDMQLEKDRPNISFTGTLGFIRRIHTFSPTVSDNSKIKNVTYEVATDSAYTSIIRKKTITESLWRWQWNTFNDSAEGLDNGSYYIRMTVYDYAGLSDSTYKGLGTELDFTLDNDYVSPVVKSIAGYSEVHGPDIAEVGWFYSVEAEITDSGSTVSTVSEAFLFYKLNDTGTIYTPTFMVNPSGDIWKANIPAAFINSDALEKNITFYVIAEDGDDNPTLSNSLDAGVIDTIKPDITAHIPVAPVDDTPEGPLITISVTVEDNDTVDLVTLVWREGNDTGLLKPDPWEVTNYISHSGDTWEFAIPTTNVTVDGLDYYLNASDPSGNVNDGSASSPYHIIVNDKTNPDVEFDPIISSPTPPGQDVSVRLNINDNDLSFSTISYIDETGIVRIGYKIGAGIFSYFNASHTSGDSSKGQDGIWEGTIKGGNFTASTYVTIRAEATDQSGKVTTLDRIVEVAAAGKPIIKFVTDSQIVSGTSSHILSFDIINDAIDASASATIENITIKLFDNTKLPYDGDPLLIQVDASGDGGSNPRWTNSSNPSEGTNGTKIELSSTISLPNTDSATITLTYANSSKDYFNLNDLTVLVTLEFSYAGGTSYDNQELESFDTPITAFQTYTQTRYMRSDSHTVNGLGAYNLDTTQSTSFMTLNEQTSRWSGSLLCTWGIRVYVRHSDSSQYQLTNQLSATVQRDSDGFGLQSKTWDCPYYDLSPTDAIVIEVYMNIGPYEYGPVVFITEQLGGEDLVASTWNVWYYTERDYNPAWNQQRTRGIFYWGDSTYNSRIENFKFKALLGGGGTSAMYSSSFVEKLNSEKPSNPSFTYESKFIKSTPQVSIQSIVSRKQDIILSKNY